MSSAAESAAPDLHVEDPRIGQVVQDRYRIVRRLGEGGMGIVYEGEHLMIKRRVAIKLLHTQFAADPMVVKRFHNEAIAATSIGNPHIIECTDMGRLADGTFFMVLEFLAGHDFDHLIEKEGPQPLGRVVHILSQTCEALQAAHDKGIIHRDLKPENLYLINRSDDPHFVKVLDFGIAKFMEGKDESMTQTGQTIGTPHFMSPEQLQGSKDLDVRADLYALGVIMYNALTGRFPFEAETFPLLIMSIFNHPPVPITTFRNDLPPDFIHIINKLLAKNPEHRFSSASELRAALRPFRQVATAPEMLEAPPPGSGPNAVTGPMGGPSHPGYAPPTNIHGAAQGIPGTHAGSSPGAGTYPGDPSVAGLSGSGPMVAQQPASKLPMIVALGSLLVALAVVVVVVFGMNRDPQAATNDQPNTPTETDPAAEQITVHIAVTPVAAALFLDGDPIPNPFITTMESSRDSRRLEARLEGHQDRSEMISLRYPLNITWQLEENAAEPEPAPPEEVATPSPPSGGRSGRSGRRGSSTNTVAAAQPATPSPAPAPVRRPPVVAPTPPPVATPPPGGGLKRIRF